MTENVELIPAKEYGERFGFSEAAVIHRIKKSMIDGLEENGVWYVREQRVQEPAIAPGPSPDSRGEESAPASEKSSATGGKGARPTSVRFVNDWFVPTLVIILVSLILFNTVVLALGGVFSLIPIAFQVLILILLFRKSPKVIVCIRAWALLVILAGVSATLSTLLRLIDYNYYDNAEALGEVTIGSIFYVFFAFTVGIPVFIRVKKYIVPVRETELLSEATAS